MRRAYIFLLSLANLTGLLYLLMLGWFSRIASDDYSYGVVLHRDGFFGGLKYWYLNLQGRFAAHAVIEAALGLFYDHHINMVFYHAIVILLGIYSFYILFKNATEQKQLPFDKLLMLNVSCFIFILVVYNNFQFNIFYWLTNSPMYFGGVILFLIGIAHILNRKNDIGTYLLIILCFLYTGSSSENFAAISILLLTGYLLLSYLPVRNDGLNKFFQNKHVQKTCVALLFCTVSFIIMVVAPGNKVRLDISNALYKGYETVPLAWSKMPSHVLTGYGEMLIMIVAKLPLLLLAAPVFMFTGSLLPAIKMNSPLKSVLIIVLLFVAGVFFFIIPSIYAQACLGPARQYTYISFFICLLAFYAFLIIGNLQIIPQKAVFLTAAGALLLYSGIYLRDTCMQTPGMKKYAGSEDRRIEKLDSLNKAGTQGVIVVDSLYTQSYLSYSNVIRNTLRGKLDRKWPYRVPFESPRFEPLFFNEISTDTAFYINSDMAKMLNLHFGFKVIENKAALHSGI